MLGQVYIHPGGQHIHPRGQGIHPRGQGIHPRGHMHIPGGRYIHPRLLFCTLGCILFFGLYKIQPRHLQVHRVEKELRTSVALAQLTRSALR